MPKSNEDSVKHNIIRILTDEKGWKWDQNLYGQQYSHDNKRIADLTCYDKNENSLIVFEIKDKGKDLKKALGEQAVEWAKKEKAPIAYATDGSVIKTWHFSNGKPLILNGKEVNFFLDEEIAYKFLESNEYNTTDEKYRKRTRKELINIFAQANDLIKEEGITKGLQRFGEFCNLLFLKLISEQEEKREKPRIDKDYLWNSFKNLANKKLLDTLTKIVWGHFQNRYGEDIFTPLKIKNPQTLQKIIKKLTPLTLSDIEIDVKGEAFEYFLQAYSGQKGNDLGEYFTPRHIVKFMVEIANPQIGEKVYDPFCGTGGMLTESYKHIQEWMEKTENNTKFLEEETIYGNDLNEDSCRVTKMAMILSGDGQTNIHKRNSLNRLENGYENEFDVVITNMPFLKGTYENTEKTNCHKHKTLLEEHEEHPCHENKSSKHCPQLINLRKEIKQCSFCLELLKAKKDENNKTRNELYKYYLGRLNKDNLSIEHCFRVVNKKNPKSRIIMIVPERILFDPSFTKLRKFIYDNSVVEYIVSLPRGVFYARNAKASILFITNINSEVKEWEEEKEPKQKHVWHYTVEIDGWTFTTRRKKIEGENDLNLFLTKFRYLFQHEKDLLESNNFFKLDMEKLKQNDYISIPNIYRDFTYSSPYDLVPLSELIEEVSKEKDDADVPVWSITNKGDFIPSTENFSTKVFSDDTSNYKLVFPQHFAYNPARINIGSINFNETNETCCVSGSYAVFKVSDELRLNPRYLLCLFQSEQFKEQVEKRCFGTVRDSLDFELFKKITIPLPSLEKQEEAIKKLFQIKQSIKNAQKTIADLNCSLSLSLYCEKRTSIKRLGEIAEFQYGYTATASEQGEFRYIRITDIDEHGNISDQEKVYVDLVNEAEKEKYLLKQGDILVARTGPVGKTTIFQDNEKAVFASYLIRINLNKEVILPKYYWYFTRTKEYLEQVNSLTKEQGTAHVQFNSSSLKNIKVLLPSLEKQEEIVSKMEKKDKIMVNLKEAINIFCQEKKELLNSLWKID